MNPADTAEAARLVAMGLRAKHIPSRETEYRDLVRRYQEDELFAATADAVATGLGLHVLDVSQRSGIILAADAGSVFEVKMEDYARRSLARGERRDTEKVLHGIVHLAVAALCFPRADDLANSSYVGRVSVDVVDVVVRDACRALDERTAVEGDGDPTAEEPELEKAWRAYVRRPEVAATKDSRHNSDTTRAMISRALRWLADRGLLQSVGDEKDGVFRTTSKYQVHVRQLASHATFKSLLSLGVVPPMGPRLLHAVPTPELP
ncbi:hypothetical protein GCM10022247_05200 [Allokutzneria multivorans]|uniref:Uncharacterized protein n=1 Tax=Allokutzneria multivorans TaxID=1142134 RepID=A0ABP7QY60_9PSEU